MLILILGAVFLALAVLTFRPPAPKMDRLLTFLLMLGAAGALGFMFMTKVLEVDPNPTRLKAAHLFTDDRFMDLTEIVPGAYGLNYIHRLDADGDEEEYQNEWLVFYQYDVTEPAKRTPSGPFGAILYDTDNCRPPSLLSFELIPSHRDYLGEDAVNVNVENIIVYADPLSGNRDRPEVLITGIGATRKVVTDLNIFRKVGVETDYCILRRQAQATPVPQWNLVSLYGYQNIGSFRGNYLVKHEGASVTVLDRAGFERSQFVVRRLYTPDPKTGSYFRPGTQDLVDPTEYSLDFAPDREPDTVTGVFYPEKAVLAFSLLLGKDKKNLEKAKSYLSPAAQTKYDLETYPFGLVMPRKDVARVLVWQLGYQPDITAEQAHGERFVSVMVVGVKADGTIDDRANARIVTWKIVGVNRSDALPYGCEWRLDEIVSVAAP